MVPADDRRPSPAPPPPPPEPARPVRPEREPRPPVTVPGRRRGDRRRRRPPRAPPSAARRPCTKQSDRKPSTVRTTASSSPLPSRPSTNLPRPRCRGRSRVGPETPPRRVAERPTLAESHPPRPLAPRGVRLPVDFKGLPEVLAAEMALRRPAKSGAGERSGPADPGRTPERPVLLDPGGVRRDRQPLRVPRIGLDRPEDEVEECAHLTVRLDRMPQRAVRCTS